MSTTLRWGLAMAAVGIIGLGLLLLGVALGRATRGLGGYEPADVRPNIYSPGGSRSNTSATPLPERSTSVEGSSGPAMMQGGAAPDRMEPGPDMMEPDTTQGDSDLEMMGDSTTYGHNPGVEKSFGPDEMGPGMMDSSAAPYRGESRGMMGH
jgi:hypothetical protein